MITVLIPTFERERLLLNTLDQLKKDINKDFLDKVLIFNNGPNVLPPISTKKTQVIHRPKLNLLELKNKGLKNVNTEWVLILDDDLIFDPGLVSKFYSKIQKFDFDLATGILEQNNLYKFPDPLLFFSYGQLTFYKVACLNHKKVRSNNPYTIDFAPGGFLLARTSVLRNLKYDTAYIYPFFNEDTDITFRATRAKSRIMLFSDIRALHIRASTGGNRKIVSREYWYYAFGFNNVYYFLKNFGVWHYFLYSIFRVRDHLHVLKSLNLKIYKSYLVGVYEGIKKAREYKSKCLDS